MQTYDTIVIGNGLAGAAISYELSKVGQSVLLIDDGRADSGTRYSYGGIGYWAGTTELTEMLFRAGIVRHRELPDELGVDTQLRELDLLLTVAKGEAIAAAKESYCAMRTPPQFVDAKTACEIEPQLNPTAIEGAFTIRHAQVDPMSLVAGYNKAFRQLGGHHNLSAATGIVRVEDTVTGVMTQAQAYAAKKVIVAAGAYSLQLLRAVGVQVPLYFTHAEIIETAPLDFEVRSLIMPATNARTDLESASPEPAEWQKPNHQVMPPVLEAGVIQFQDKTARIGQISRFHTALMPPVEASVGERAIREAIAHPLPNLKDVPGTWRHCLVTFTQDNLPLLGSVPSIKGLHLFSGFTGPFALVPPVAQRYAQHLSESSDEIIEQMTIARFL
ncbi:FAD dependent oxidoreductase, putative [Synechococcus sp. PCC 7335]|uniref:NAD(P)/FAD-dependent oxidoreductase n=1 Tax=Synechococcus sp. (strain ATCC 29403 / PCC 7335) TaxID=91464 RepID=UPI00017EDCBB|nr:FAD-binding oxidoreductase [Synechococcus sp. PCC 7335]EDX85630.1 FAD dependent oxidoreductase, putative [Synechococcus sp. PCC 7335]